MTLQVSLVLGTMLFAPGPSAGTNTVGVPPISVEGAVGTDLVETFSGRVDERLDATEVRRVNLDEEECTDLQCQRAQATSAGANVILRVTVSQNERDYVFRSEIVATSSGEVLRKDENYCEICTYDEALETLTQQIDNIRDPLAQAIAEEAPGAPLSIASRPPQAVVRVDGTVVGSTPYDGQIKQGDHVLTLNADGYVELERPLEVATLDPITLDLKLRRSDKVSIKGAVGWGLVGISVPLVISGVVLMAIDENPHKASCSGASKDANGTCEFRYNTLGGGIGLTVGGVLAAGGGAALLVIDRKERGLLGGDKVEASAFVTPRGAGVRGRF